MNRLTLDEHTPLKDLPPQFSLSWNKAVVESYPNIKSLYFINENKDLFFPLMEVNSKFFGKKIVSLPFIDFGGVEGKFKKEEIKETINSFPKNLKYVEIKISEFQKNFGEMKLLLENLKYKLVQKRKEAIINLKSPEEMFKDLKRVIRKAIRKAKKNDLKIKINEIGGVSKFYKLYSKNMNLFGSPQHSKKFFLNLEKFMEDDFKCLNCYKKNKLIGALIFFINGNYSYAAFSVSDFSYRNFQPNELLHWEAMKICFQEGAKIFDLGQCEEGAPERSHAEGIYNFKMKWPVILNKKYSYRKSSLKEGHSNKDGLKKMSKTYGRLPLFITKFIGPKIISQLGI